MRAYGITEIVACILLVALHSSSTLPVSQKTSPFESQYPGCPNYEVGQHHPTQIVTLDESLTFLVKPSHPSISFDVALSQEHLYKAEIHFTSIELKKCDLDSSRCETINEGGTKSSNLLDVDEWNYVYFTLNADGQITVSVNLRVNVMGNLMSVQWDEQKQHSNVKVTLLPMSIPDYSLQTTVFCNNTYTPEIETIPVDPSLTTELPEIVDPFPKCPVYEVEEGRPLEQLKLEKNLMLAVFPTDPSLQVKISSKEHMYQVTIDHTMTELYKCSPSGTHCEIIDIGGAKDLNTLDSNEWNYVNISLVDNKVTMSVNAKEDVISQAMVVQPDADHAMVDVIATNGIPSLSNDTTNHTTRVNVFCKDALNSTETPFTTTNSYNSAEPIEGETTTVSPKDHVSDSTNTWRIIAIILAVILCVIIALVLWHCIKNRSGKNKNFSPAQQLQ